MLLHTEPKVISGIVRIYALSLVSLAYVGISRRSAENNINPVSVQSYNLTFHWSSFASSP